MKITTQELCKALKDADGENWTFGYGYILSLPIPCLYVKGKSFNDIHHEYNTQIPISLIPKESFKEEDVETFFGDIDWNEVYSNAKNGKIISNEGYVDGKLYEGKTFSFGIPYRVAKAIEKCIEKNKTNLKMPKANDDGRGGKQ